MAISKDMVTVVVPTFNEEKAISLVLDEIRAVGYENILVVDGYSVDGTVKVAESRGVQAILQNSRGKTGAIKTAVDFVKTPYMLVMDGDHTYDPADIERFLIHAEKYDQVIGYRTNGRNNIPRLHRLGNWMITKAFNLLMDTHLSDVCSGMWLFKTEVARQLELGSSGFALEVEVAAQAKDNVTEVPISYKSRIGERKLRAWRDGFQILTTVISLARVYNPVLFFSLVTSFSIIPAFIILGWVAVEVLLYGKWHDIWAILGMILLLVAFQSLALSAMSALLKRMERRIMRSLRKS